MMRGLLGVQEMLGGVKSLQSNQSTSQTLPAPSGLSLAFIYVGFFFFIPDHCIWLNLFIHSLSSMASLFLALFDFSFYSSSSFCSHLVPASAIFLAPPCLLFTWSMNKWDYKRQTSGPNYFVYVCICMPSATPLSLIFLSFSTAASGGWDYLLVCF